MKNKTLKRLQRRLVKIIDINNQRVRENKLEFSYKKQTFEIC